MKSKGKTVVYIAGPITGVANYREAFDRAQAALEASGCITLNPAHLPEGMTPAQYMRICLAMVDDADEVCLLPGWENSGGAKLEKAYAEYTGKGILYLLVKEQEAESE